MGSGEDMPHRDTELGADARGDDGPVAGLGVALDAEQRGRRVGRHRLDDRRRGRRGRGSPACSARDTRARARPASACPRRAGRPRCTGAGAARSSVRAPCGGGIRCRPRRARPAGAPSSPRRTRGRGRRGAGGHRGAGGRRRRAERRGTPRAVQPYTPMVASVGTETYSRDRDGSGGPPASRRAPEPGRRAQPHGAQRDAALPDGLRASARSPAWSSAPRSACPTARRSRSRSCSRSSSATALTSLPLLRAGLALAAVVPIALASDTLSIATMEVVDNAIVVAIPGALDAGLGDLLFWGSLSLLARRRRARRAPGQPGCSPAARATPRSTRRASTAARTCASSGW